MTLDRISKAAQNVGLCVRGAFHPTPEDGAPIGTQTLVLLGPDEPKFWHRFRSSPEYLDSQPDPLDRWSVRVVSAIAPEFDALALYPFGGPPYQPFLRWAALSARATPSPVGLLAHDTAGLFISFRGALAMEARLDLPASPAKPCDTCATHPCETACPVGALGPGAPYNVAACRAHVASDAGRACRDGCLVRRACPVSQSFGRVPEQSAFHMKAFLPDMSS